MLIPVPVEAELIAVVNADQSGQPQGTWLIDDGRSKQTLVSDATGAELPRIAFVIGTGRCGSTLVHEILARHPGNGFVTNLDDKGVRTSSRMQNQVWRQLPASVTTKGRFRFAPSEAYRVARARGRPGAGRPGARPGRRRCDAVAVPAHAGVRRPARCSAQVGRVPAQVHRLAAGRIPPGVLPRRDDHRDRARSARGRQLVAPDAVVARPPRPGGVALRPADGRPAGRVGAARPLVPRAGRAGVAAADGRVGRGADSARCRRTGG